MSSYRPSKPSTSHEAEILERQRQVAAQLAGTKKPPPPTKPPPPKKKPSQKRPSQLKTAPSIQSLAQKQKLKSIFEGNESSQVIDKQKRPAVRNKPAPPTTAAAALAAARTRVAMAKTQEAKKKKAVPVVGTIPKQENKPTSKLSQLVQASAKTMGSTSASTSYGNVEPNDYWKNMRDWDFLRHLYKEKSSIQASVAVETKELPDTFVSHSHYMAAWAPLCLNEARAQLLSECLQQVPYWHKAGPVPVKVKPFSRNVESTMDCITVQVASADKNSKKNEPSFLANDVVLLVSEEVILRQALRGQDNSSFRQNGLVGHTEYARKSLNGLTLVVSKKWWAKAGREDMVLLKIGSNVTALREFTALCRVESIPLRSYLLGNRGLTDNSKSKDNQNKKKKKKHMVDDMGGVEALGKGFAQYAQKKFNQSQLGAISAAAREYGDGGFTLIKGPPGTGKTTTLVALLNSLHIRQYNKYYQEVRKIAAGLHLGNRKNSLAHAAKSKPRLLVCAPSNAAVDNVILKIMEDGFVDGNGCRYNPSIVRVGVGQSTMVKDVALESKVEAVLENNDVAQLDSSIAGFKMELQRIQTDIMKLRKRVYALSRASPWPLSKDWEIRIDEDTFEETGRTYFVNHKEKTTTFEVPPPPEPDEKQFPATAMPEYRSYQSKIVKLVDRYYSIEAKMERCRIVQGTAGGSEFITRQQLETHFLDAAHIVMTTLGTAGNRVLEAAAKFEVVVVDEAAQSVEPSTLSALQLGSSHAILVGDPQQLPATIFSVSGRNTKYDRSLFQRLEEAGHEVHLLNRQYRMHPAISDFPRRIFYGGNLLDGPNVIHPEYGNPLKRCILTKLQAFQPFMVLDLDSKEERGGTSLANSAEAHLAVYLYESLRRITSGLSAKSRVAVITPYAQQANLLRRCFSDKLGTEYTSLVEVNTVDAFQGREASIVIFSCVRAAGSKGIGFLSDVRRMNVALTRAKHFLFVIARCKSIVVNPYWRDLVKHARETSAVVKVHMEQTKPSPTFPDIEELQAEKPPPKPIVPAKRKREDKSDEPEDGEV